MSCLKYLRTQSCLRFRLTSYAKQPSLNGSQVTTPGFFFTHFIGFQFRNALLCFGPHFCCLPRTPSRVNMQKPYTKSTRKNFVNQIAEWDVWTNWFTLTIKKCMLLIAQVQRRSPLWRMLLSYTCAHNRPLQPPSISHKFACCGD